MDTPLQQRIVGAIVLVALGVIFIPAILDGSGYKSRHARTVEIPDKPKFPPLSQERVEEIPTPIDDRLNKVENAVKPVEKVAVEKAVKLKSWMLQVGSFDSEDKAVKYRDELRGKGYTTHVIEQESKGKKLYKVRIGPDISKDRIEKLRDKLKKQGIDSYVVTHG